MNRFDRNQNPSKVKTSIGNSSKPMLSTNSYDEVPYTSLPFAQTHPDRLATLATLFGLSHPPLASCRVLELGCAAGGNLIPMAEQLPDAEFVGVDLSAVQVASGQAVIDTLGFNNVRLIACNIEEIDESYGDFDYILCHGVYSWVPATVQERILAICHERLQPDGIAYISYNTLPGWHMRSMIRDLMRFHALGFASPSEQVGQARAILDFLAQAASTQDTVYSALLKNELEVLQHMPDSYIFHEHLEEENEPIYFREFIERTARHKLKYLAETDFNMMLASRFPANVTETLHRVAPDIIGYEQLMDFVVNRTFRQSLLIHDHIKVDRNIPLSRIEQLRIASPLAPVNAEPSLKTDTPEAFGFADACQLSASSPLTKAALLAFSRSWPTSIPWHELVGNASTMLGSDYSPSAHDIEVLQADMLQSFMNGLVLLNRLPPPYTNKACDYPKASALARSQAKTSGTVTSLRHEQVNLDAAARTLIGWLDGQTSTASLCERLVRQFPEMPAQGLTTLLDGFAKAGLLVV
jgi:SAM-dependent methyltransferase/methyltransferase-like protein